MFLSTFNKNGQVYECKLFQPLTAGPPRYSAPVVMINLLVGISQPQLSYLV